MVVKMKKAVIIISLLFIVSSLKALTLEEYQELSFDEQLSRYEQLDLFQGQFPKGYASNYLVNTYGETLFVPVFQHLNAYSLNNTDELFYIENLMYLVWVMKENQIDKEKIQLCYYLMKGKLINYLIEKREVDDTLLRIDSCMTRVYPELSIPQAFPKTGIELKEYYEDFLRIEIELTFENE